MSMLSARPDGRDEMRRGRTIHLLVGMLKPGMDDLVLEHIGSALGNLANHSSARAAMKDAGIVSAVTRLLCLQHRPRAQVWHACECSLMSTR